MSALYVIINDEVFQCKAINTGGGKGNKICLLRNGMVKISGQVEYMSCKYEIQKLCKHKDDFLSCVTFQVSKKSELPMLSRPGLDALNK